MRRLLSSLVASALGLSVVALGALAHATPKLDVAHVQGRDAPWVVGWNEAVVTLDNADGHGWRGEVAIDASFDKRGDRPSVRVPVSLAAGESARLLIPFHLQPGTFPNVLLRTSADGEVSSQSLNLTRPIEGVGTIVEIQGKEARGAKLIEVPPPTSSFDDEDHEIGVYPPPPMHGPKPVVPAPPVYPSTPPGFSSATAQVSTVQVARESGDPSLPDVAGGWSGAVVVVAPSEILARLQGRSWDALEHWVLSGGTIAIAVTREEDLRSAPIKTLLGFDARVTSTAGSATTTYAGDGLTKGDVTKEGDDGDFAPHGLGEVWLLRRDPWARTFDPKSPRAMYGLWSRAMTRRAHLMSLPAGTGLRWYDDDRVRKFLDPNHGFRPSLGVAAILVVAYALLVGPLSFGRARKLGRPLAVLRATPVLALAVFAALVGIGKIGKGMRGKARRLALVDVAGGATRATATTFHAFYVSDASSIEVVAPRPIDTVHAVEPFVEGNPIDLDRDKIAVRGVRAHPWQTVVVAEEGAREIPGGIVLEGNGPRLTLINKTPWTLEHVVLHPEGTPTAPMPRSRYFARVAPGATVVARDGVSVDRTVRPLPFELAGAPGGEAIPKPEGEPAEAIAALDALVGSWQSAAYGAALPVTQAFATAVVRTSMGAGGPSVDREATLIRVVGLGGGKGKGEIETDAPKGKEHDL